MGEMGGFGHGEEASTFGWDKFQQQNRGHNFHYTKCPFRIYSTAIQAR
jgi:hypothetical protein